MLAIISIVQGHCSTSGEVRPSRTFCVLMFTRHFDAFLKARGEIPWPLGHWARVSTRCRRYATALTRDDDEVVVFWADIVHLTFYARKGEQRWICPLLQCGIVTVTRSRDKTTERQEHAKARMLHQQAGFAVGPSVRSAAFRLLAPFYGIPLPYQKEQST